MLFYKYEFDPGIWVGSGRNIESKPSIPKNKFIAGIARTNGVYGLVRGDYIKGRTLEELDTCEKDGGSCEYQII
jgi:hypothetical protein